MSQPFTATERSVTLQIDEDIPVLDDIERNGSCFTDGVGEVSKQLARQIARELERGHGRRKRFFIRPAAFQFRMGGFKGVIAINHELEGVQLRMRKSLHKFSCKHPPRRL